MTPQSTFMVLATINRAREGELRQLLDSMNHAPGRVDPNNDLIPFADFDTLHFARLIILDDKTTEDVRVYGLAPRTYPLYLAFLGDVDGDADAFLGNLAKRAGKGLARIFSCCEGFTSATDLLKWTQQHDSPAIAAYVNWRGRTVRQIREEAALYEALENYIEKNAAAFRDLPAREAPRKIKRLYRIREIGGTVNFVWRKSNTGWMADQKPPTPARPAIAGLDCIAVPYSRCAILCHCASSFGKDGPGNLSYGRSEAF